MRPGGESRGPRRLPASGDGIAVLASVRDPKGRTVDFECLDANPAACSLLGSGGTTLCGRRLLIEAPWLQQQGLFEAWARAMDRQISDLREIAHEVDGVQLWLRVKATPSPDGLWVFLEDVTSDRDALEALRRDRERYVLVSRATNDVIWDWDLVHGEVQWSRQLHAVLGYTPQVVDTSFEWWIDRIHVEDRERVLSSIQGVIDLVGDSWSTEYRCRRADGSFATVLERGYVARDPDGRPIRLLGSLMDVTERRRQDEEREREAVFRERFIGVLGHDLGNPLASIRLSSGAMLRKGELSSEQRQMLQRIDLSAERMARLVRQLLDFTRARMAGGIPLELAETSLEEVCRGVISELELAYPERRVEVEVNGLTRGLWDPERLAQVLSNLVANALEHSPAGTPVRVSFDDLGVHQGVTVHNEGKPIPDALRPHLFEPFRGARTQRGLKRQAGLGLGLYIVREIVHAHGGAVEVHSAQGAGTTFTVKLPRSPLTRSPAAAPRRGAPRPRSRTWELPSHAPLT